jgi:hypothetical protein
MQEKERQGSVIGEDSLLERVTAAAEGLVLETLPSERVGEFYHVLDTPNPFSHLHSEIRDGGTRL